jgi:hypothetical protein
LQYAGVSIASKTIYLCLDLPVVESKLTASAKATFIKAASYPRQEWLSLNDQCHIFPFFLLSRLIAEYRSLLSRPRIKMIQI